MMKGFPLGVSETGKFFSGQDPQSFTVMLILVLPALTRGSEKRQYNFIAKDAYPSTLAEHHLFFMFCNTYTTWKVLAISSIIPQHSMLEGMLKAASYPPI